DLRLPASNAISALLNLTLISNNAQQSIQNSQETDENQNQIQQQQQQQQQIIQLCPMLIGSSSSAIAGYKCAPGLILTNQSRTN
ncbi:MAG: hypothetical protein N6V41_00860, partial [Candidatus Portiera aleyrodidarum]|nr:hypothetical protein [Candidatus Portiera aleyrodidarum]